MSAYAGDTVRVHATAEDINNLTALQPANVSKVTCQVWYIGGAAPLQTVPETVMGWDATNLDWYLDISTVGYSSGGYQAVVYYYGLGATPTFFKKDFHRFQIRPTQVTGA